jgi:hypothetical protein
MTKEEEAIVNEMYRAKNSFVEDIEKDRPVNLEHKTAYCTTAKPIKLHKWNGTHPVEENETVTDVPVGSTLKIVMVSRMGDCGLTDELDKEHGYGVRVPFDEEGHIKDIRWEK